MKVSVLEIDKPNANGRFYSRAAVENAMKKWVTVPIYRCCVNQGVFSQEDLVGSGRLTIEDNQVVGECTFSTQEIEEQVKTGKLFIRTHGIGSIDKNGVIGPDYEFVSLILTDQPA